MTAPKATMPATTEGDQSIALVEMGYSHEECLPSQIMFLKHRGYTVHVLVSAEIAARKPLLDGADQVVVLPPARTTWRDRVRSLIRLRRYLKDNSIGKAVFNTAEGARARDFSLLAPPKVELVGVVHNGRRLWRNGRRWNQFLIARRFSRYLVLADYILDNLRRHGCPYRVQSFLPIFFPNMSQGNQTDGSVFRVCVPGRPGFDTRDYEGLLDALRSTELDDKIRFVFPCDASHADGPELRRGFEDAGLIDRAEFFNDFLDKPTLLGEVAKSQVVLPLIHPSVPWFEQYQQTRITGSFNLAFATRTPMVLHQAFRKIEDFASAAVFYDVPELVAVLNRLARNPDELLPIEQSLRENPKLDFEYQADRYVDFVVGAASAAIRSSRG